MSSVSYNSHTIVTHAFGGEFISFVQNSDSQVIAELSGATETSSIDRAKLWLDAFFDLYFSQKKISASATMAASVSCPNATLTTVPLDTLVFDNGGLWDSVNNRFTVPDGGAGVYTISAGVDWELVAGGDRSVRIAISGTVYSDDVDHDVSANTLRQTTSYEAELADGDYIDLRVRQTSGSTITTLASGGISKTFLSAARVH